MNKIERSHRDEDHPFRSIPATPRPPHAPSWRDAILNDFVPNVSKLTLVADPDGLLSEEHLARDLRARGFDLIAFRDAIEFRYVYESQYRSVWDKGHATDLIVALRASHAALERLPYDVLQMGRKLAFHLGDLFPTLSYPVIEKLDRSLLDALFAAQRVSLPDRMGDNATKDFILRHVFGIATDLIASEVELLRVLLRLHYRKLPLPLMLAERLIQVLKGHAGFAAWPLTAIVPDDEAFFAFLQERWPLFLHTACGVQGLKEVREREMDYAPPLAPFRYPGPAHVPFDHQDLLVYLDNLFLEGRLKPVHVPATHAALRTSPYAFGIVGVDEDAVRVDRLFDLVTTEQPTAEARSSDWTAFALKWAELTALVHCRHRTEDQMRLRAIGEALNTTFAEWLVDHYASLINLPPTNPAMVHHVPRRIARDIEASHDSRAALIVVDGLALDQWVTIRQLLRQQDATLIMRESATFAWIPTLTSVSRQALFAGKPPLYFPSSINTTNSEAKLWNQFWEGQGLSRLEVAYQRGLGDGDAANILASVIHPGKTRVVGLVVDTVDKIMHGMQLGAAGMHNQITQWCQGGFLTALVGELLAHGYEVWLTADHGNLQSNGAGRPSEGVIAETRGARVRVYPTPELRAQVADAFPFAHAWQPVGLPAKYFPLVVSGRDAFVSPGETIVGHGGVAIEEVIVPLVKVERRPR